MKYIFPAVWIVGFGAGALATLVDQSRGEPNAPPSWIFAVVWSIGTIVLVFYGRAIKRVETDDINLYISNYFQEIKVPFSNVEAVSENRWINQRPVTIRFRSPNSFGNSVMFIPATRLFGFWRANPVVAELKRLAGIDDAEPVPRVPLGRSASRIPGASWIAARLAAWDNANPTTFLKVNLAACLFVAITNSVVVFSNSTGLAPTLVTVVRDVVLPLCVLIVLTGLFGLVQPDTKGAVLRLHGVLLLLAAGLLVAWMADIAFEGIPSHSRFSWSPGFSELFVCYATFLFTRFTLTSEAQKNRFTFYLPALILFPVVVLDLALLVRFFEMFFLFGRSEGV